MEFVRGLHNIKLNHQGCVLSIGNFDGFHLGHQALIAQLKTEGMYRNLPTAVMIFEPQPKEYFYGKKVKRLTRLRDKINYLFNAGVDIIICLSFNKSLASLNAEDFIKKILVQKLKVRFVCVGDDFRFGACKQGDLFFLKDIGNQFGLKIIHTVICTDKQGRKISSSFIRELLENDCIMDAEKLLGHSYMISGRVVYGNSLGKTFGFPTANISLQNKWLPINGVYAVEVYGIFDYPLPGIANIGVCPTLTEKNFFCQQKLEVHILNKFINLYHYHINVVICKKLRDEKCFSSLQKLQYQIQHDIILVKDYFKSKILV